MIFGPVCVSVLHPDNREYRIAYAVFQITPQPIDVQYSWEAEYGAENISINWNLQQLVQGQDRGRLGGHSGKDQSKWAAQFSSSLQNVLYGLPHSIRPQWYFRQVAAGEQLTFHYQGGLKVSTIAIAMHCLDIYAKSVKKSYGQVRILKGKLFSLKTWPFSGFSYLSEKLFLLQPFSHKEWDIVWNVCWNNWPVCRVVSYEEKC